MITGKVKISFTISYPFSFEFISTFLLFQYQIINFYKIIKNYSKENIILSNSQY